MKEQQPQSSRPSSNRRAQFVSGAVIAVLLMSAWTATGDNRKPNRGTLPDGTPFPGVRSADHQGTHHVLLRQVLSTCERIMDHRHRTSAKVKYHRADEIPRAGELVGTMAAAMLRRLPNSDGLRNQLRRPDAETLAIVLSTAEKLANYYRDDHERSLAPEEDATAFADMIGVTAGKILKQMSR